MSNRKRAPRQTVLPVTPDTYQEVAAALVLAGADRAVGRGGIQLGRYLLFRVDAPAEPAVEQPASDPVARHRARVL
jgi:hypothetical protein